MAGPAEVNGDEGAGDAEDLGDAADGQAPLHEGDNFLLDGGETSEPFCFPLPASSTLGGGRGGEVEDFVGAGSWVLDNVAGAKDFRGWHSHVRWGSALGGASGVVVVQGGADLELEETEGAALLGVVQVEVTPHLEEGFLGHVLDVWLRDAAGYLLADIAEPVLVEGGEDFSVKASRPCSLLPKVGLLLVDVCRGHRHQSWSGCT